MAQTPSDSGSGSNASTLPRGKACLRCRKRKMRCDGAKPACGQCSKAKKPDSCQFDDGKGKTRTQALREKITKLEEELAQMRDPDYSSPSIVLLDPHAHYYSGGSSSSSATGSPSSMSLSVSPSPYSSIDSVNSPQTPWTHLRALSPPLNYHSEDLPLELSHMLFDIFVPHRHQCGFALHPERLRATFPLPSSERRHPVLMNAIYLWACFLSRPSSLSQHEAHYLAKAQEAVVDAIHQPSRAVDLVQAQCLLARYFFANGRMLEASHYASAAATLAVQAGLHRLASAQGHIMQWNDVCKGTLLQLDPPHDAVELGERIAVFWQAYTVDRCLSVALQRPTCIVDDDGFSTRIDTPWPEEIEEYENMSVEAIQGDSTLRMFFAHQGQPIAGIGGFSLSALRVKAVALYDMGTRLAASWGHRKPSSSPSPTPTQLTFTFSIALSPAACPDNEATSQPADFRAFEVTLARLLASLLPVHQLDAAVPEDRRDCIMLHTLAQAAMLQLHQRFAREDATSFDKCLRAAKCVVVLAKHVTDVDYEFLDPIIGACWATAASILALEQVTWSTALDAEVQHELDTIIFAMTKLNARFPLANVMPPDNEIERYRFLQP